MNDTYTNTHPCFNETTWKNETCYRHFYWSEYHPSCVISTKSECIISSVTIGIGILIFAVVGFRMCVQKCKCFYVRQNDNSGCYMCIWSLMDEHLRGTILVKFLYFMIKPVLI